MTGENITLIGAMAVAVAALAGTVKYLFARYERQTAARIRELRERINDSEKDEPGDS